jgi:putative heme-binding domain-containing protein
MRDTTQTNEWRVVENSIQWEATRTAVVICDMWDKHHCPDATERVGELAPRMNQVVAEARRRGALIIHCPSDTMGFYTNHPGRLLAQQAPKVQTRVPLEDWCSLKTDREASLPIDDTDGGCDGCPDCPSYRAWTRQHPAIEIRDGDAITDSAEAYYLMRQRGITNVIVMGVHINMCVLGRPFSIRQMVRQGQNVLLMRDMTDSMYNHLKSPFVSHFRGTELVVEHIEKYWCPSITSSDVLPGPPFRFKSDVPKHVVCILGENEYHTWETLPEFANQEIVPHGYRVSYVAASPREGDGDFKNWEAIQDADLLLVSVRRRMPPVGMLKAIRSHLAAGRPLVGIRTASHAFDVPNQTEGLDRLWPKFDDEVLGANYQGHYGAGKRTVVRQIPETSGNAILNGVETEFTAESHLYKYRKPVNTLTPLLSGRTEDGQSEIEPVAWINTRENRRVFYTSLGSPADFKLPSFRRLLMNGIIWALGDFIPPTPAGPNGVSQVHGEARTGPTPANPASPKPDSPPQLAPLSPSESLSRFHVASDLALEQILSEPEISQPVSLNFDDRGRLWVVEYRQYPHPAGLKMVSRDNVWRAVYDKVPPPPPHHFKGKDRISIHEDVRHDGTFSSHKVFVDGLNIATSVEFGRDGIYVMNPPYLLFYPDANRDDIPDGDPEVLLSGFGLEDTHSVANSLHFGPDGWLYGCQGSTVTGNVLVYGKNGQPLNSKPVFSQGQNIWRYHPQRRIYEVFSEGGGNAFGLEMDSAGNVFSGHNGGNTRGFHYLQGAYLQKGFDKHGPLSNPYAFGYFPAMTHPDVERFTHTFLIYEEPGLPDRFRGRLLGVEPLQGRIVMSALLPVGSTFRTEDLEHPVTSDDRWFRPVDIKSGPDGAVYVADWYDRQVNHYRNHEGQIDASNGRVYRLISRNGSPGMNGAIAAIQAVNDALRPGGSTTASERAKIILTALASDSRWLRQQTIRKLYQYPDAGTLTILESAESQPSGIRAWDVTCALNSAGGLSDTVALRSLSDPEPLVRSWAIRLLGDFHTASEPVYRRLADMGASEPDLKVRAQLASTARRLPSNPAIPIIHGLLQQDLDAADARQPLLLWWAIESQCTTNPEEVFKLFSDRELWRSPLVHGQILSRLMRRFAQSGSSADFKACANLFRLSPSHDSTEMLMAGFEEAFKDRPLPTLPDDLLAAMEKAGAESLWLSARRGQPEALQRALERIASSKATTSERLQLMTVVAARKDKSALPVLLNLLTVTNSEPIRVAAISALGTYDEVEVPRAICGVFEKLPPSSRNTALAILSTRVSYAQVFLNAVEADKIDRTHIPSDMVRRIKKLPDTGLTALASKLWPRIHESTSAELELEIHRIVEIVNSSTGNPYPGKKLFDATCGPCHKLFGKGGAIGPELTVYPRSDLDTMVLNVVHPNAEIREGYESYTLETKDGRVITGFMVENDTRNVVLRGLDGQNVAVSREQVQTLVPTGVSIMPEGLLSAFENQQLRDLFAYLRCTQPLHDAN